MILAVFEKDPEARGAQLRASSQVDLTAALGPAPAGISAAESESDVEVRGPVAVAGRGSRPGTSGDPASFGLARADSLALAFSGRIYNAPELRGALGAAAPSGEDPAALALALYRRFGEEFARRIHGPFSFALAAADGSLLAGRDHLGLETLYWREDAERVAVSSDLDALRRLAPEASSEIDPRALSRFLLFNYNPGPETLVHGIRKLRPGHLLLAGEGGVKTRRFWKLSFASPSTASEQAIQEGLLEEIRRAVGIRMPASGGPAVFVSGGMDSSTILALCRESYAGPLHTYAYRCRSESFDESHYARLMAGSVGAEHVETEYRSEDVLLMSEIVGEMADPFCDVGINIGTYLLGRAAGGKDSVVFTGDGGDELFAGHPVYEADKIARFVDPIPAALRRPLLSVFSRLPDSDQKKNLVVKLKRFAESMVHPRELLTDRWRVYYALDELGGVLAPAVLEGLDVGSLFDENFTRMREADGPDPLSRTLYGDYQNVVDFYLRRNDLIRRFGIETRYPLLDPRLVEYCAAIPSKQKIRGWFEPKYVFHQAMEGVLPHEIVHRQDKLGHSIPLKNWLRDDARVREFVLDHLSEETVRRRGLVRPAFVARQVEEHMSRRRNNSHRLWTLAVLEMWMRAHLDR